MLDAWIAGVKASGPVQVQDLWSEVENNQRARQILRDEGVTDELLVSISENMKRLEGRVFLQGSRLATEVNVPGQDQFGTTVFTQSSKGMPRTVTELRRRGQFERMVDEFERGGLLSLGGLAGQQPEIEVAEIILSGTIFSVQSVAEHKRKLEDTELTIYTGNEPGTVALVAAILAIAGTVFLITGSILQHFCEDDAEIGDGVACTVGKILVLLALLCFAVASFAVGEAKSGFGASVIFIQQLLSGLGVDVEVSGLEDSGPRPFEPEPL
jgi:hypothetical protein